MASSTSYIAGVHAVAELLKQRSGDVQRLLIKKGRHDGRVQQSFAGHPLEEINPESFAGHPLEEINPGLRTPI
jgi:tRNA G18 (ribose-2'-O)-methylase SpoU